MKFKQIKKKSLLFIILIMIFYVSLTLASDITKIIYHFSNIKYEFIPLILMIQFLALVIKGLRQKKLLDDINVRLTFKENLRIYFAGISLVSTPLGLGQAIKSQIIKEKYGISRSKTLPIIILERFFDLVAITLIVVFTIMLFFNVQSIIIASLSSFILIFAYVLLLKGNLNYISRLFSKIRILKKILPSDEIYESLHTSLKSKQMIISIGLSVIIWMIDAFAVYLVFLSFDLNFNFIQSTQYYLTSLVYGSISFLPGGVGLTEGSLITQLMQSDLDLSLSSAVTLFVRSATIWFATIIGLLFSFQFIGKKLSK